MATTAATRLEARKQPRQARSQATVDVIFEATLQVLLAGGATRLTTTRVAERAGVSVGTLYQYYPHKQALLYAVLERHLLRVGTAVGAAAQAAHGKPLAAMVGDVVQAFVRAKTERVDESRALYAVAGELDTAGLVQSVEKQGRRVVAAMLATAPDARFDQPDITAWMFTAALIGPTRNVLESGAPPRMVRALPQQLLSLCLGYLEREARRPQSAS
ncbi:MAG: TetR family transcriptional regulator [Simplicispira suum]|uniref:TetR/AcrR family transcriptional regulator n=1 Tax=Simplicispira suum TaxID=2109915 RepID=UPI001C6B6DB6|nr:TetR/AcrR family transcriptional regulator [Simplicispira suum]MBW7833962.1 TetR family transcriptional regulator [Simplicispira suum]